MFADPLIDRISNVLRAGRRRWAASPTVQRVLTSPAVRRLRAQVLRLWRPIEHTRAWRQVRRTAFEARAYVLRRAQRLGSSSELRKAARALPPARHRGRRVAPRAPTLARRRRAVSHKRAAKAPSSRQGRRSKGTHPRKPSGKR